MELTVHNVLSEKDAADLLKSDVQYATLVSSYKKISEEKLRLISSHHTSFLGILIGENPHTSAADSFQITGNLSERVHWALSQKIALGLMAVGKIPLKDVTQTILRMDPSFVSQDIIERVCSNNPEKFSLKETKQGKMLYMRKQSPLKKLSSNKRDEDISPQKLLADEKRTSDQLKYLCRTKPNVLRALKSDTDWKTVLGAHQFWYEYCVSNKTCTYVEWLLKMAKWHASTLYQRYEDNLFTMIVTCIIKYLNSTEKSLKDVTGHICLNKPRFIGARQVREIVLLNQQHLCITQETLNKPVSEQMVTTTTSSDRGLPIHSGFALPAQLESRIKPLLSTRTNWDAILSAFKIVVKTICVQRLVSKYGCFYEFLIEYGKYCKPKLSTEDFKDHLQKLVRQKLISFLSSLPENQDVIQNVVSTIASDGLLNAGFVRDTIRVYDTDLTLLAGDLVAICDSSKVLLEDDPMAELECPRILHLLTAEPHFMEILNVFKTLPDPSLAVLCKNSMSFFEWLINLSKRLMPHDAAFFELHLQGIIQREVLALHSTRRCQMTIHHLHSQLCDEHPMLLSPNFLSWCLDKPTSAFCVYKSWVYLRTAGNQRAESSEVDVPCTSRVNPSESFLTRVMQEIHASSNMTAIIRVIKSVPADQIGLILQSDDYWYDFLENNIKERKERQRLADLLAEEAKKCLGVNILHMKYLIALLSNGIENFVSAEALEYVMMQRRDHFAVSSPNYENARVGLVRDVDSENVKCEDEKEDALMRQILLYFPSTGSCHMSTLMAAISKGDSFLYKESGAPTEEYVRCFFMMFPMLFYIRGEVVVLTCTALEKRACYKTALYPTSTTDIEAKCSHSSDRKGQASHRHGRARKRSSSGTRRRSSKHRKHRRSRTPSRERSAPTPIEIEDDEDEDENGYGGADTSADVVIDDDDSSDSLGICIDEGKDEELSTKQVVEGLPEQLIVDVTANILLTVQNPARTAPLMKELLSMVVSSDDAQRIEASEALWCLFERKTMDALKQQASRFCFEYDKSDPEKLVQIRIVDQKPNKADLPIFGSSGVAVKTEKLGPASIQQVEISSTSTAGKIDPVIYEISDSDEDDDGDEEARGRVAGASAAMECAPSVDDVIKLPPSNDSEAQDENLARTEICRTPSSTVPPPQSAEVRAMPRYSTTSTSYLKPAEKPITPHAKQSTERGAQLLAFFREYFNVNAGSCSTELLIQSAYRRFETERFARSRLAFEAYVYDFSFRNCKEFVLSGSGCEYGVTWMLHRRGSSGSPQDAEPDNLEFLRLIPSACKLCRAFLSACPNTQAPLDEICKVAVNDFRDHLQNFSSAEVFSVVRALVLVTMIRNLRLFCFSVDASVVYLRRRSSEDKDGGPRHKYKFEIENILQNPSLTEAVLLMAELLESGKSTSQTALRSMWQMRAPSRLAKVFGTGISFTLSLRKYDFLFPTSEEGFVEVNGEAIKCIERSFRVKTT